MDAGRCKTHLREDAAARVRRIVDQNRLGVFIHKRLQVVEIDLPVLLGLQQWFQSQSSKAQQDSNELSETHQKVVELALDLVGIADDLVQRETRVRQENVVACETPLLESDKPYFFMM